jgi:GntR family transcriptional repressor for pyruvate dehydrogenase complex
MSTTNTLSHDIADVLRNEILRDRYHLGDRMPSERDLASRFGANRGAVREAMSQLEQLGIIRIQPGGARVQSINSAGLAILGPLMALNEMPDPVLVEQFLHIFGTLSSLNARNALPKANSDQIKKLQALMVPLSENADDFEAMEPHWRALLETLGDIADNLVVRLISNDLKAQIVGQMMDIGISPKLKKSVGAELVGNLRIAFESRDGDLAAAAISTHFDHLRVAVTEAINIKRSEVQTQAG